MQYPGTGGEPFQCEGGKARAWPKVGLGNASRSPPGDIVLQGSYEESQPLTQALPRDIRERPGFTGGEMHLFLC